jgi:phosphoenolpyruvate synthase/pyruvate phosphate dikinase
MSTAIANVLQERGLVFVKQFDEIGIGDIPSVGGKNASLGRCTAS